MCEKKEMEAITLAAETDGRGGQPGHRPSTAAAAATTGAASHHPSHSKLVLPRVWGGGLMEKRGTATCLRTTASARRRQQQQQKWRRPQARVEAEAYPKRGAPAEVPPSGPYAEYPCPHSLAVATSAAASASAAAAATVSPMRSQRPHPPPTLALASGSASPGAAGGLKHLRGPLGAVATVAPGRGGGGGGKPRLRWGDAIAAAAAEKEAAAADELCEVEVTTVAARAAGAGGGGGGGGAGSPSAVATPGLTPRIVALIRGKETLAPQFAADVRASEALHEKGFERVWCSLERLLERLRSEKLSDVWSSVSTWLDQFYCDRDSFKVAEVCRDCLRAQYAVDSERKRRHPNPTMTALAMAILDHLFSLLERLQPVLVPVCSAVRREVHGAIYANPPPPQVVSPLGDAQTPDMAAAVRVLKGSADRYMAKAYYSITRDFTRKMQQVEDEMVSEETKREKQTAVMDRVISYWQLEFQKLILKSWKLANERERRDKSVVEAAKAAGEEKARLGGQIALLKQEIHALKNEHARVQAWAAERSLEKDTSVVKLTDEVERLQAQNRELVGRLAQAQENSNGLLAEEMKRREELQQYQLLLKNLVKACVEGPKQEVVKQEKFSEVVRAGPAYAEAGVTEWVQSVVCGAVASEGGGAPAAVGGANGGGGAAPDSADNLSATLNVLKNIKSIFAVPANAAPTDWAGVYLALLRYLSPSVLPAELLRATLKQPPVQQLEAFFASAEKALLLLPFQAADVLAATAKDGSLAAYHGQIVAALFARFADSGARGEWQRADAKGVGAAAVAEKSGSHPLWETVPSSPAEWTARVKEAFKRRDHWREMATMVRLLATRVGLNAQKRQEAAA